MSASSCLYGDVAVEEGSSSWGVACVRAVASPVAGRVVVVDVVDGFGIGGAAMRLREEVRSHHTAWVSVAGDNERWPVLVRYALGGESLVMFGDGTGPRSRR